MITFLKAPDPFTITDANFAAVKVFLAGGISNCPNWQEKISEYLEKHLQGLSKDYLIINPRRDNFDVKDASAAEAQIKWEHEMLERSDVILFWFPKDTLCPITLYELGNYTEKNKHLIIGVDPDYKRKEDVIIQTQLRRANFKVEQCFNCFLSKARQYLEKM